MRKTKIVCTIGPASGNEEMMKKMMLAGMNVCRLNLSHGNIKEHQEYMDLIKKLRKKLKLPVAILLDTKGPEIRTGKMENGAVELAAGNEIILTTEEVLGNAGKIYVDYEHLPRNLTRGDTIMIDDGRIELLVKNISKTEILCDIIAGATLKNSKGVNVPGVSIDMPYMSERDKSDLLFGIKNDVDYFAISFVRSAQDVKDVRRFMHSNGCYDVDIISKIEDSEGVKNIKDIINVSDGIMVARGDMGVEIPFEELPNIQKKIITDCCTAGKRVITATEMLESMIQNPRPTRAEITDVANAIYDGTSATMLSAETSVGAYPLKALETMCKIAMKTESHIDYTAFSQGMTQNRMEVNITNAISDATCRAAHDLHAEAIVVVTLNGGSARMISRFRPQTPIIAVTPNEKAYMKLALAWGITPIMNEYIENAQDLISDALNKILDNNLVNEGEIVVVTGSTQHSAGATNTLQAHIVGNILLKGSGNGAESISGRICVIKDEEKDFNNFRPGDILVAARTTNDILHLMRQCKGVITEEDERDSGIVPAGYALDIPVISGARGATAILKTGTKLKVDAKNGYVYNSDGSDATDG